MRFQTPLVQAVLLRRYKRFLADIRLTDGREVTAHCPNPGSMLGLADPGASIWVEPNEDPRKKLKFGWRLVDLSGGDFVCVDTGLANRIVRNALEARTIPELAAYDRVRPEQAYGTASRVDFLLSGASLPDAYVEVKSMTLSRAPGQAEFPDSVTARGTKHLGELAEMAQSGHRAVLLYLVQRTDTQAVTVAQDIDPAYAKALQTARAAGVTVMSYRANITPQEITIGHSLPFGDDRPLVLSRK